jgi:hypothetical protein
MTPYSCLMDDGTLLQVSAGSLSYAPNPKSRKSRLDAVINFCAALASLLLGLLFAYIGLVMFISFFRDNLDWWILPLSLCFGGVGAFIMFVFPQISSTGIRSMLKTEGENTTVMTTQTWSFWPQRTTQQSYATSACQLKVIPNHNTKHDEHSFMLCLVHVPSATERDLTSWLQPREINPCYGSAIRREAEVIAQAMMDAGLIAEVAFTEHWAES